MKYYLIYQVRNKLNGMIYIGKHMTNNKNDGYMGSGLRIKRAIEKYGLDNFEKTILFECSSKEEMNAKEAEIVNEDFIARDDVYNIKLGGEGGWDYLNSTGLNHSGKFRNELLIESLYQFIQKYGKTPYALKLEQLKNTNFEQYKEHCQYKSHVMKQFCNEHPDFNVGKNNPMYGKHHSAKSKHKMSEKKQGQNNNQYGKMWICNDETHESKTILKSDPIPLGWRKGRFCK